MTSSIAGAVGGQQRVVELGATRELAGGGVQEDLIAAGGAQRVVLSLRVLVAGENPSVADSHRG